MNSKELKAKLAELRATVLYLKSDNRIYENNAKHRLLLEQIDELQKAIN